MPSCQSHSFSESERQLSRSPLAHIHTSRPAHQCPGQPTFTISPHPCNAGKQVGVKIWGMSSTVTGLCFLKLNLLSSFALPSSPFCCVLHLCAQSSAHGTPGPTGRSCCSDTTPLLSRVVGVGTATFTQQSRDATTGAAHRGMPRSGWVSGSPTQLCLSGRLFRSKGLGWGSIPACGSSSGNAMGCISRRQQRSGESLQTPGSESGSCRVRGMLAAVSVPSPPHRR